MDELEAKILRVLGAGLSASSLSSHRPRWVARQIGVSHPTVRERMQKLRRNGVLGKPSILLNPRLLGKTIEPLLWRVPEETKPRALANVAPLPVIDVRDFFGDYMTVIFWHESTADRRERLRVIRSQLGGVPVGRAYDESFPRVAHDVSPLDKRILEELLEDATASTDRIAKKLHVSRARVRDRVDAMWNGGVFIVEWDVNRGRLRGTVPLVLHVRCDDSSARIGRALSKAIGRELLASLPGLHVPARHHYLVLAIETLEEAEVIRSRVLGIPGVELVLPLLPRASWSMHGEYEREMRSYVRDR